ncbi:MAG TPA: alanine--tRNA ligase [Gemmatimonadota bacterium]|nr:alanine--tRNA ligase [Gemmatimonadota bacterium]
MQTAEIRQRFIDYFERHVHEHLPSSSLVPADDPTLLFTNAGMVQFKRSFQGEVAPPAPRAVTVQKCLRVSGKHNDLEEVGRTARHHTFFEMLGNFSFGDYFKSEAIRYAWEFVTEELGLEPDRLWATVHVSDDEAREMWLETSSLPGNRVLKLGDAENFWQMGETGPCGPCSELHYDLRPEDATRDLSPEEFLALGEADRFMEIWNLVFMQYDRDESGEDHPLPAPSIDTGAGLERIAAILQGARTNYHTDLFLPIIHEAEQIVGLEYPMEPERWEEGLSFRVLADHARAVAFLLADGVFPSNEGRGYVLRRILRRAGRHAWLLGRREPTLDRLVSVVVDQMSDVYPELGARREHLVSTTRAEEERFLDTIDEGMRRFEEIAPEGETGTIPGDEAFRLYDTFGFPLDLTELMAGDRGWAVDEEGFHRALEEQRERSREDRARAGTAGGGAGLGALAAEGEQEFVGYRDLSVETPVLAATRLEGRSALILERNPFYAEAGGQVSDRGRIRGDGWELAVGEVVRNERGQVVVAGELVRGEPPEEPGAVEAEVEAETRGDTERNHTATHLLHAALRSVLGEHVQQAGSLVAPDRLRFDFSHRGPMTREERREVERRVNRAIWANAPVEAHHEGYREAIESGAMALFGEKYGDEVRVIRIPGISAELCGGCHVRSTGQIGLFRIVSETGVAAGIRRIEAVTGPAAYERVVEDEDRLAGLSDRLGVPVAELGRRVEDLLEERDRLRRTVEKERRASTADLAGELVAEGQDHDGSRLVVRGGIELPAGTELPAFGDRLRDALGSGAALVHVTVGGEDKQAFLAVVTDDWIGRGLRAGSLVKAASGATGSGGGGRPHLAQGGVGDPGKVEAGLEAARAVALEALSGALKAGSGEERT